MAHMAASVFALVLGIGGCGVFLLAIGAQALPRLESTSAWRRFGEWAVRLALRAGLRPAVRRREFRCPCCGYRAVSKAQLLFAREKRR
jgi:hypothetical protein